MGKEAGKIFEELGEGKEHDQNTLHEKNLNNFKEWSVMVWGGRSVDRMYVQISRSNTQHKLDMVTQRYAKFSGDGGQGIRV